MEMIPQVSEFPELNKDKKEAEKLRAFSAEIAGVAESENKKRTAHFPPEFDPHELTIDDGKIWRAFQELERQQKLRFSGEEIEAFKEKYDAYTQKVFADFDSEHDDHVTSRMMFQAYLGNCLTPYYLKVNSGDLDRDKPEQS